MPPKQTTVAATPGTKRYNTRSQGEVDVDIHADPPTVARPTPVAGPRTTGGRRTTTAAAIAGTSTIPPLVFPPPTIQPPSVQPPQVQQPPAQNSQNASTQAGQVIQLTLQTSLNVPTTQAPQTAQNAATGNEFAQLLWAQGVDVPAANPPQHPTVPQPHPNVPATQTQQDIATAPNADTPTPSIEPASTAQASDGNDPFNNSEETAASIPERDNSPESHHSHHDAGTQTTPPPRHPSHESEHGSSSSSSNNASQGLGRGGRPIRVPTPGGSPDPDQGAVVDEPDHPQPERSFWEVFVEQVHAGVMHLKSKQACLASVAGFVLLVFQLCSAGRLCYERDEWCFWQAFETVTPKLNRYFVSYICLLCANVLTVLSICDLILGYCRAVSNSARRRLSRQPREPVERLRTFAIDWADLCDEMTEPFLIPVLVFGLQTTPLFSSPPQLGEASVPIRLCIINGILHLVKWVVQTVEIVHGRPSVSVAIVWIWGPCVLLVWLLNWPSHGIVRQLVRWMVLPLLLATILLTHQNFPYLQMRRPLVFILLWTLAFYACWQHESTISEDIGKAARYLDIGDGPLRGLAGGLVISNRAEGMAQSMGINMIRVTHKVITEWVQPTDRA